MLTGAVNGWTASASETAMIDRRAFLRGVGAAVVVGGATPLWASWLGDQMRKLRGDRRRIWQVPGPGRRLTWTDVVITPDDYTYIQRDLQKLVEAIRRQSMAADAVYVTALDREAGVVTVDSVHPSAIYRDWSTDD